MEVGVGEEALYSTHSKNDPGDRCFSPMEQLLVFFPDIMKETLRKSL
jgi:hypothetical protein